MIPAPRDQSGLLPLTRSHTRSSYRASLRCAKLIPSCKSIFFREFARSTSRGARSTWRCALLCTRRPNTWLPAEVPSGAGACAGMTSSLTQDGPREWGPDSPANHSTVPAPRYAATTGFCRLGPQLWGWASASWRASWATIARNWCGCGRIRCQLFEVCGWSCTKTCGGARGCASSLPRSLLHSSGTRAFCVTAAGGRSAELHPGFDQSRSRSVPLVKKCTIAVRVYPVPRGTLREKDGWAEFHAIDDRGRRGERWPKRATGVG